MNDNSNSSAFKTLNSSNISNAFLKIKEAGRIALMPFLMAGDPDLRTTSDILLKLQDKGADIIELGIPYSDPLADGPVIQLAASRALSSGTSPSRVFEMLDNLKNKLSIPVILFSYTNPLLNRGFERFCKEACDVGVSGLVIPDLPLEEAKRFSPIASERSLDLVLLVAPTTPKERIKKIAEISKGFIYLVSVTGVTGARSVLDDRVESLVKQIKESSSSPVAVGFGISAPKHIHQVRSWGADGAIVGSALVNRISNAAKGCEVQEAGDFISELRLAAG
tara:strand:+ start:174 stop:1010 length:837 start_codon:yes stop_codon:yes gene_type:complete